MIKDKAAVGLAALARGQIDRSYLCILFRSININLVVLLIQPGLCHGCAVLESMKSVAGADIRLSFAESLNVLIDNSRDNIFAVVVGVYFVSASC